MRDKLARSKLTKIFKEMPATIFVVFVTVIYVKYLIVEISLKLSFPLTNAALTVHLIVTVVA